MDYQINPDVFPKRMAAAPTDDPIYGQHYVGMFSAGKLFIQQPFYTLNSQYIVDKHGDGTFSMTVKDSDLSANSITSQLQKDKEGTNSAQINKTDDTTNNTIYLKVGGKLSNRIFYSPSTNTSVNLMGIDGLTTSTDTNRNYVNGNDAAVIGSELMLGGGFIYDTGVLAKTKQDMSTIGKVYMLSETSRVWTNESLDSKGLTLDTLPLWTDPTTALENFPKEVIKDTYPGYDKTIYSKITSNADGTQTLKWVFTYVAVGVPLESLHFSTDIGIKGSEAQDISIGTTNLKNTARIFATHDMCEPAVKNGNLIEKGISVVKGAASSFAKLAKEKLIEPNGIAGYTLYYGNNGTTSSDIFLMDTMPYHQDPRGSQFSGTYSLYQNTGSSDALYGWKLLNTRKNSVKPRDFTLYYTEDAQYKDQSTSTLTKDLVKTWTSAPISTDGTAPTMAGKTPTAWAILGSLTAGQQVKVELNLK